jgi:hypothetical protein
MAHGLRSGQKIKFHQALHGYAEGHRQLAISTPLKPRDLKAMLVLSDLSGPSARIDEAGYLTGYPLPESRMYVLARTWPAPEMPRPGCAWTHTILIDFADLATIDDPSSIVHLFRRPSDDNTTEYGKMLEAAASRHEMALDEQAKSYAQCLVFSLYAKARRRIVAPCPEALDPEAVTLAIWAQQWPRLRRVFRFCTSAAADRSSEWGAFDLQLLPTEVGGLRARFPQAVDPLGVDADEPWLADAVEDLVRPNAKGLRSFLRRVGGDVTSGRSAFSALCRLHDLMANFESDPSAVAGAIALIEDSFGVAQARAARGIVASAAIEHPTTYDAGVIDFLVRNIDLADAKAFENGYGPLGREVWKREPTRYAELLDGGERLRSVAESGFALLSTEDLLDGLARVPQFYPVALARRPDLVASSSFWSASNAPVEAAFARLASEPELRISSVKAMIAARRGDLAPRIIREFGASMVLRIVASKFRTGNADRGALADWLATAVSDLATVAKFLAEESDLSWDLLSDIAIRLPPDAVPNEYGVDPWILASAAAGRAETTGVPPFLGAYLLTRALGRCSHSPGELAQLGFEPTHRATSANQLPQEAWRLLEPRLPSSWSWFDWDRCLRIRAAVGDLFVDRELSPGLFANITGDDRLFAVLAEAIAHARRGREFLQRVRRWMKGCKSGSYDRRIPLLEKLIGVLRS